VIVKYYKIRAMLNIKKINMWYQVKELKSRGLTISQIGRDAELDRATVRKYLQMNEDEFHHWISNPKKLPHKLSKYVGFIKQELENCTDLSAAQIEDRLKEIHVDLPSFHSKTVYNLVQTVRQRYDIAKPLKKESRAFEKLPETAYGEQAQVDFGQTYLSDNTGKKHPVYFFAMVLSRSRYKFVHFVNKPFTSESSIAAHELALEYFEGSPKEILYDQDKVFIHSENLGDYKLTQKFQAYSKEQDFKIVFCRKADPQSKGKIENVVKYVKQNFLRGRVYSSIENLNKEALAWLSRTANQKPHASTLLKPVSEWQIEKEYLLKLKQKHQAVAENLKGYCVRKDNTILCKSNFYSLPLGTYAGNKTMVFTQVKEDQFLIYNSDKQEIARHSFSLEKGKHIRNTSHRREQSSSLEKMQERALEFLNKTPEANQFLELLHLNKVRYFRDNLQILVQQEELFSKEIIKESLVFCLENKQLNTVFLVELIRKKQTQAKQEEQAQQTISTMMDLSSVQTQIENPTPETSSIEHYEKLLSHE